MRNPIDDTTEILRVQAMSKPSQVQILDRIVEKFYEELKREAVTYRERVVIPFCDNYRLAFGSAMGSFWFYDRQWYKGASVFGQNNIDIGEWFEDCFRLGTRSKLRKDPKFLSEAKEIVDVLNYDINCNSFMGFMIENYCSFKVRTKARTKGGRHE